MAARPVDAEVRLTRVPRFGVATVGEFTAFEHPTLVSGRRWLLYPSASYPLRRAFGFLTPKLGFHATRYDLTSNTTGFESGTRALPILSVDSGLAFERATKFFGQPITQTLEPRLFLLIAIQHSTRWMYQNLKK